MVAHAVHTSSRVDRARSTAVDTSCLPALPKDIGCRLPRLSDEGGKGGEGDGADPLSLTVGSRSRPA